MKRYVLGREGNELVPNTHYGRATSIVGWHLYHSDHMDSWKNSIDDTNNVLVFNETETVNEDGEPEVSKIFNATASLQAIQNYCENSDGIVCLTVNQIKQMNGILPSEVNEQ